MSIYDEFGNIDAPGRFSPFEEMMVAAKDTVFQLKSIHGVTNLRDITTTSGSGTVTNANGQYEVKVTGGTDTAQLQSGERGVYMAGLGAESGVGIRLSAAPTGSQVVKAGLLDDDDGIYIGQDSTGIFLARDRGGSNKSKVYQNGEDGGATWSEDKLDGNGKSGITLDLTNGVIYQPEFSWYGHGPIVHRIAIKDSRGIQHSVIAHIEGVDGSLTLDNPNLPVRARVESGGTSGNLSAFVAGRAYNTLGKFAPNLRINAERRFELGSIGTTVLPLIAAQRKTGDSKFKSVRAKVEGFDLITDTDAELQIRLNPSFTGSSFGTPSDTTASETAFDFDNSATAISGGELLFRKIVASGQGSDKTTAADEGLDLEIPEGQPVAMAVRTISGSGATMSGVLRIREEW